LDWLAGVFYTHEDTPTHDRYYAVDPATSEVAGLLFDDPYPTTYAEQAVFGDITVHFTDRFNVQIGGRASENKQSYSEIYSGPLLQGDPLAIPPVHTQDSSFTYLLTPSFKIAPDLMLYGRLASGYRPGGPNPLCTLFDANCSYEPDTTTNYEIGIKGQAFDHALSFEGSVYYIDWKDVQIALADPDTSQSYFANATRARSRGVELSMQARPLRRLTIAAWVAWNDATLSESLPVTSGAIGFDGDRLPNSARFSGHLSLDSDWPVTNRVTAFWGASLSYVGTRQGGFPSPAQAIRYEMPGYAQTNLRVGARYESWMVNLYVNNLADKRGQLAAYDPSEPYINYTQPRTAGIGFTKTFP
jgi:outer membrane receptor protein involved in Fe transport